MYGVLGKALLAAAGAGFAVGLSTSGKFNSVKNKVEKTIRPKKNKIATIKVELEEGVEPEDLRFMVVQPVKKSPVPVLDDTYESEMA